MTERAEPKRGEVWQHFKGGLYFVLHVGRMEANPDEKVVIYTSHDVEGDVWVRPMSSWMSSAPLGVGEPRFRLVLDERASLPPFSSA